jgi:uncharacterized protein (TIGR02391 family)
MSTSARNKTLERLATDAEALANEPRDSPKVGIWRQKARTFVENEFGEAYLKILNGALFKNRMPRGQGEAQQFHVEGMGKAALFLRELQAEEAAPVAVDSDVAALTFDDLHPEVRQACAKLYDDGHLPQAVENGFKTVRARLRKLTGHETGSEAFGKGKLRVEGAIDPYVEQDFNEAVKFLTMAIDKFRNEKAHTSDANLDPVKAFEYIAMSSLAMRLLDHTYIKP